MKSLTKFGTYGFLSALIATQMTTPSALLASELSDKADRAGVDAKKSVRSMKQDIKKGARKATGQDNTWDDVKDEASDAGSNIKDEANYQKRKLKRKTAE
jgi:hypothetical protein